MTEDDATYASYLLRLYRSATETGVVWRVSLQNARTGEVLHFATLKGLTRFLNHRFEEDVLIDKTDDL